MFLAEVLAVVVRTAHHRESIGELYCRFEALGEALLDARLHFKAVDYHVDRVFLVFLERGRVVKLTDQSVDARANKTAGLQFAKDMQVLALAFAHDWGKHVDAAALGELHYLVNHLADGLRLEFKVMLGAVRFADAGE